MPEASAAQTFLFSDIEGSTRLLTRLGPAYEAIHADHQRLLRAAWAAHGGREVSTEGDSFFVVFVDAADALVAAAAAHRALAAHPWPAGTEIRVRIGIHSGHAVRVGDDYLGLDVNRAARVSAAGHGGQTLVSEAAREAAPTLGPGLALRDLGRHRLKDIGVVHLWQLDVDVLPGTFGRLRSLDDHPSNLPAGLGTLVDRTAEVEAIVTSLGDGGLVTLTGPGGTGKSRVAVEVARALVTTLPDGVFHLDLAAIDTADRAGRALLEVLEIGPADDPTPLATLVDRLRGRALLLLLDNADRVADAAGLVGALARSCPGLRLLVTSRSPVRVAGERELPIGPLGLPPAGDHPDPGAVLDAPAVALFLARAREIRPGFTVSPAEVAAVAEICRRLDGLPLAIELAAARTRVLGVEPLLERLSRRLPLLAGGPRDAPERQRTMAAAIEWSYDLLDEAERALLDHLSVFEGSFGLTAVEAIAGPTTPDGALLADPVVALEALVERSLVARADYGDPDHAFRLLGTVREFALERLVTRGDAAATRDRHLAWLVEATRDRPGAPDRDDVAVEVRLEGLAMDVAAALAWALPGSPAGGPGDAGDGTSDADAGPAGGDGSARGGATVVARARVASGLSLAAALGRHWWLRGHLRDGAAWLDRALAAAGPDHPDVAQAEYWAGVLHEGAGDDARAADLLWASHARLVAAGDRRGEARTLNSLGVVARSRDDLPEARALLHRAPRRSAGRSATTGASPPSSTISASSRWTSGTRRPP